jgi:PadR family transcriptional regulator PadR
MDTSQLLKGVLDVAVLAVLEREDGYGYDVVRRLRAAGIEDVGDASVYGTLRRLYSAGALTSYVVPSDEGPHRKYYGITTAGRSQLKKQREDWQHFSTTVTRLLDRETTTQASTQAAHQGAAR